MDGIRRWFRQALCDHDWRVGEVRSSSSMLGMFAHPTSPAAQFRQFDQERTCRKCGHSEFKTWDNGALNGW